MALVCTAAACAPEAEVEPTGESKGELLAGSKLLWPMVDGAATIRVCFLPIDVGTLRFPIPSLGPPDLAKSLAERKQWVRQAVEAQWNRRTVLDFVGWQDCASAPNADVKVQLISSKARSHCTLSGAYGTGETCVEAIGTRGKGKRVFINVTFGEETVYHAKYKQSVTEATFDPAKGIGLFSAPNVCGAEVDAALAWGAKASAIDAFRAVEKACLQNVTVHEFGHVAGFSHEHNRTDTEAACAKEWPASGGFARGDQDTPLGPFDGESIMSYCRRSVAPTLTAQDVSSTNSVYRKLASGSPANKTTK